MATINLRNVPDDVHHKSKIIAAEKGISLQALVVSLLEKQIELRCISEPRAIWQVGKK